MVELLQAAVVSYRFDEGKEALMGSLIDELKRREAAAREEAEELRGRIAELSERLAGAEERVSRLVIARETVEEVLNGAGCPAAWVPTQLTLTRLIRNSDSRRRHTGDPRACGAVPAIWGA